jgi:hypothetical protein
MADLLDDVLLVAGCPDGGLELAAIAGVELVRTRMRGQSDHAAGMTAWGLRARHRRQHASPLRASSMRVVNHVGGAQSTARPKARRWVVALCLHERNCVGHSNDAHRKGHRPRAAQGLGQAFSVFNTSSREQVLEGLRPTAARSALAMIRRLMVLLVCRQADVE